MTTFNVYRDRLGVLTFEAPVFEEGEATPLFTIKCKTQSNADKALNALIAMEDATNNQIEEFGDESQEV